MAAARLLGVGDSLYVFVGRDLPGHGAGRGQLYRHHDDGVCLANIALAATALGIAGSARLLGESELTAPDHPPCPAGLESFASLGPVAPEHPGR